MLKYIGAAIFIIGGIILGLSVEKKYKDNIAFWRETATFLNFCQSEINHYGSDLTTICNKLRQTNGKFSGMIADCLQYNTGNDEAKVLKEFAIDLVKVDLSAHNALFDRYRNEIEKKISEAKGRYKNKGKTYLKLIPLLCAGIVILLW